MRLQATEHAQHTSGEHHRQVPRSFCALALPQFWELLLEHSAVEKDECIQCHILRRRCDMVMHGQVCQKGAWRGQCRPLSGVISFFSQSLAIEQQDRVSIVPREGHERDVQMNPYSAYHCLRMARDWAIVANGSHTDPIAEKIEAGTPVRDALSASLLMLDYRVLWRGRPASDRFRE